MKHLRHLCAATVLTFTFVLATFAGDMQCGVVSSPPDPPASVLGEPTTRVTVVNEESPATSIVDPLTELTLNLLQSVLALF
jgi:hypothetical protein